MVWSLTREAKAERVSRDQSMYVCMYVCMVITYSRVWINPGKVASPARGQLSQNGRRLGTSFSLYVCDVSSRSPR